MKIEKSHPKNNVMIMDIDDWTNAWHDGASKKQKQGRLMPIVLAHVSGSCRWGQDQVNVNERNGRDIYIYIYVAIYIYKTYGGGDGKEKIEGWEIWVHNASLGDKKSRKTRTNMWQWHLKRMKKRGIDYSCQCLGDLSTFFRGGRGVGSWVAWRYLS